MPRSSAPVLQVKARRQAALIKIHELEKIVENWDSKDLGQCCNEFVRGKKHFYIFIYFYFNKCLFILYCCIINV